MKSKTPLVLMEQLIMVLVFAIASAWCLQVFAGADRVSKETGMRDQAVLVAQNCAELLKSNAGLTDKLEQELGGIRKQDGYVVCYTRDWEIADHKDAAEGYRMEIVEEKKEIPGLGAARVCIYQNSGQDKLLFALTVAWQEVR